MTVLHAQLKDLGSTDTGLDPDDPVRLIDLATWSPEDPDAFQILVAAEIGPASSPGADVFYIDVCSAKWLAQESFEKGFRWGHSYLFLSRWDYSVLWRAIDDLARQTSGRDWDEIALKLSRFCDWEFAGYEEVK